MSEILHLPVCDKGGNVDTLACTVKAAPRVAAHLPHLVGAGGHAETAYTRPTEHLPGEAFNPAAGDDYAEHR